MVLSIAPSFQSEKIEIASRCLKQYQYYKDFRFEERTSFSPRTELLRNIVRGAYLALSRQTKTNPWRRVTSEIDKFIYQDVPHRDDPTYDKQVDLLFKKSISYINTVRKVWYKPLFLTEGLEGFPDFKCSFPYYNLMVIDTADLVLFNADDLIICTFSDIELTPSLLYNNMRLRMLALMLESSLKRKVTRLRCMSWARGQDEIDVKDIFIHNHNEFMKKTEKTLMYILSGIKNEIFYPSISEQCNACPFKEICSF